MQHQEIPALVGKDCITEVLQYHQKNMCSITTPPTRPTPRHLPGSGCASRPTGTACALSLPCTATPIAARLHIKSLYVKMYNKAAQSKTNATCGKAYNKAVPPCVKGVARRRRDGGIVAVILSSTDIIFHKTAPYPLTQK